MFERFQLKEGTIKSSVNIPAAPQSVIIVDKKTGVNYLYVYSHLGTSITPLLEPSGKPIVD